MTIHNAPDEILVRDPAGDLVNVIGPQVTFERSAKLTITGHFADTSHEDANRVQRILLYKRQPLTASTDCHKRPCWSLLRQFSNYQSSNFSDELSLTGRCDMLVVAFEPQLNAERGGEPGLMRALCEDGQLEPRGVVIHRDSIRLDSYGGMSIQIRPKNPE